MMCLWSGGCRLANIWGSNDTNVGRVTVSFGIQTLDWCSDWRLQNLKLSMLRCTLRCAWRLCVERWAWDVTQFAMNNVIHILAWSYDALHLHQLNHAVRRSKPESLHSDHPCPPVKFALRSSQLITRLLAQSFPHLERFWANLNGRKRWIASKCLKFKLWTTQLNLFEEALLNSLLNSS